MAGIPYAEKKRTSYENIAACCPWCGKESVFNRATDLKDVAPIAFRTVACRNPSCGKAFNINGDSVNSAHEMLVFDCHELLEAKHYMSCVLTLAQAFEVFFGLFLRVRFLYRPFAIGDHRDIEYMNRLSEQLARRVERHGFSHMRALFLTQLVHGTPPANLTEAEAAIAALPDLPGDPSDAELDVLEDAHLASLLKAVKGTTIGTLRNRVVHKHAYRPTLDEVEKALEEARALLFTLGAELDLVDDINRYIQSARVKP